MPLNNRQDYVIIDLIQQSVRNIKAQPVNLGGLSGAGGGEGTPPGGFIGQLIQTKVAYDATEAATLATSVSGSLLDNLNHIRYRIGVLESGILVVDEYDGSPSVSNVTQLSFSGAIVTDLGDGHALVSVSGGNFDLQSAVHNASTQNPLLNADEILVLDSDSSYTVRKSTVGLITSNVLDNIEITDVYQEQLQDSIIPGLVTGNVETGITVTYDSINHKLDFIVTASGGSITVQEVDGTPIINPTDTIIFSGITVEDLGSGDALAYIPTQRQGVATHLMYFPIGDGLALESVPYYGLYPEPYESAQSITSGALTTSTEFAKSITPPGEPGAYVISEGVYVFKIRARRLSGTKNVKIFVRIYTRTTGGTETLVVESNETPNLTGSYANYTVVARADEINLNPTDRLVVKYVATPYDSGTNPTADIQTSSSSGYTRIELPTALQHDTFKIRNGQWMLRSETWTRTGNHTFTLSGDWTGIYRKRTKIRYRDGGSDEYGVVESSSHSAGTTTVNLIPNTDYAMAAASITNRYISHLRAPEGFPSAFIYDSAPANITVGNGTLEARWYLTEHGIGWDFKFILGSTSAVSGDVTFTAPVATTMATLRVPAGLAIYLDSGTATFPGQITTTAATTFRFVVFNASATYATQAVLSATIPFTWATNDEIKGNGMYAW